MTKAYYTPATEDIRIGYECQITYDKNTIGTHDEYWIPYIVEAQYFSEGDYAALRTPYLTKEQIEAEGWELENTFKFDITGIEFSVYKKMDGEHEVKMIHYSEWFKIQSFIRIFYAPKNKPKDDRYSGRCPSINEFRMLSKLLGI